MTPDLTPALELLRREIPSLAGVYLFGSHAGGTERAESDIDLAIFAGRPLAREVLTELAVKLAACLGRDVDLVDLAAADTIMQMQVISEGKLVEAPAPTATGLFELRVLRDYRDLKRRRTGIEADIVAPGRVHA